MNKQKILMRFSSLVMSVILLICCCNGVLAETIKSLDDSNNAVKSETDAPDGFMKISEKGSKQLWVNLTTANIRVVDTNTNTQWFSNPPALIDDKETQIDSANRMESQISVHYLGADRNIARVDSYLGSVMDETYEIVKVGDGVRITYDFAKKTMQFKIPIEIKLTENHLEAKILFDKVEEYGAARICDISLLPYFGTGRQNEEGYAFIPDGSGAVINFADCYKNAEDYDQAVYGDDPSINLLLKDKPFVEGIRMPVFGIKKQNAAFLGIIHEGAAFSSIQASSSQKYSPYTSVGATFVYRQKDQIGIADKETNLRVMVVANESRTPINPVIQYHFLNNENANYSAMANKYREYLMKKYGLKKQTKEASAVTLEFFGLTDKKSQILGVPVDKKVVATKFNDVKDILEELSQAGITDISSVLYGFQKGGYNRKYNSSAGMDHAVGGNSGFGDLKESTNSKLFVAYDIARDYQKRTMFFGGNRFVTGLSKMKVQRFLPTISTGSWSESEYSWHYANVKTILKKSQKLINNASKVKVNEIAYANMGGELYSDFETANDNRQKTLDAFSEVLKKSRDAKLEVALESGNEFLLSGATAFYEIPTSSSNLDIQSYSIPFYSMVLHGIIPMSSKPINNTKDQRRMVLKGLETGVSSNFRLTAESSEILKDTRLSFLYNTQASGWMGSIKDTAKEYKNLYSGLFDKHIVSHEYLNDGNLSVTTYENGTQIVVNHSSTDIEHNGNVISANSVDRFN